MTISEQPSKHAAIEVLFKTLRPRALGVTRRFGIPDHDAEDLIQETFLVYWRDLDSVQDPPAWILTALKRRCLMYWRSSRRRLYDAIDTVMLEGLSSSSTANFAEVCDMRNDVRAAIARVPNPCRRLLNARYSAGHSPADTATICGYKLSGIYKILERCFSALTEELGVAVPQDSSTPPGSPI